MKKRTWIFLVVYLLATLWSVIANAQGIPPPPPNQQTPSALSLTPPDTDLSVGYLSNIFGTVDGVLAGTGSQLVGAMFSIFNGAVLVLGGIVILYTLFVSTLKTAHEGEVLGKNWSSIWIPLRSVTGIALLIPKASGYSFIQIFMLWVIVMGIGAADSTWNTALDYFLRGGILMQQNKPAQIGGRAALLTSSTNLLRSLTCMEMLQRQLQLYRQSQTPSPIPEVPNFYQGVINNINSQLNVGNTSMSVSLPVSNYLGTDGVCGTLSWSAPVVDKTGLTSQAVQQIKQSRTLAVQSMVTQLYGAAQQIVNNTLVSDPANNRFELGHILDAPSGMPLIWGGGTLQKPTNPLLAGNTLSNATSSYFGIMAPTLNYLQNAKKFQDLATQWINNAKETGWILAGRYYYQVIQINANAGDISETNPPTFDVTVLPKLVSNIGGIFPNGTNYAKDISDLVNNNANYQVGISSPFIKDAVTYGNSLTYGQLTPPSGGTPGGGGNDPASQLVGAVTGAIGPVYDKFYALADAQINNANPILMLADLGALLVNISTGIFIGMAILVFALVIAAAFAWGFTFSVAVIGVLMPILALFSPVLLALLVAGLTMALYIPIIPFIIFTFGAIGWIIAVIEAVIAAPLVALGIAHPEGTEILGKAEPAVGLLVNVFLRPTFMIFGFLIGMMLSYVGIWIMNAGFWNAYQSVQKLTAGPGFMGMFSGLAAIVIYTLLVMQVVQKSFTLIYIIPDEVLKWISINVKGMGGEAEAEAVVSRGAQGATETGSKFVGTMPETIASLKKEPKEGENKTSLTDDTPPSPGGSAEEPAGSGAKIGSKRTETGGSGKLDT